MKSFKIILAGFFLGLAITYLLSPSPTQVNYIDQEAYEDQEVEKVILVDIPQEQ